VLVVNKDPLLEGGRAALWEASGTRKRHLVAQVRLLFHENLSLHSS
jgi:hypothetical protein